MPERVRRPVTRLLVVEDEPLVREVVVEELRDAGYDVLEAETAEEGLSILEHTPDVAVLFTDIRLPGSLTGWDLAEAARRLRPGLPVIYATGYSEERPRQVPGSLFMHKPYRPSAVIRAVEDLRSRA
ncbi:MAG TPA: response regulator [Beijerinckiaceae bacterium]|jgi:CheY-like chemotaxis protein